jgi:hypothetical protein
LLAWWGSRAGIDERKATVLSSGDDLGAEPVVASVAERADEPVEPTLGPVGEWIIEPDPAVLAADLADALGRTYGWHRFQAGLDWLSGDEPSSSPLASSFRILAEVPGRENDIARQLRRLGAGLVEIKPRGVRLDTDKLQRRFRGKGQRDLVVLWTRRDHRQVAFLAERQASP